ncbi:MAG: dephospho-CoA kinase [Firmicutes bacterium]|nr:dephospho-CoA kinase [Bacillota bacterium]
MIYGLTGGIGSGKTTVSKILRDKGFIVLDADEIGKEVTAKGEPLLRMLVKEFGVDIIQEDGELDRRKLANLTFGDREKTNRLNELVQTAILCRAIGQFHKLSLTEPRKVMFFDVPLLYEAGWDRYMEQVWLVTAPEDVRIERVEVRDGLSEEEIRQRIRLQMSEEEKSQRADVIIENDGGMAKLMSQVEKAIAENL